MQNTDTLLMIRPVAFRFNPETAENNYFQKNKEGENVQEKALAEFNTLVKKLKDKGINVIEIDDTLEPHTPDSIYPNNWISMQHDGSVVLYPMYAKNRRWERRTDIVEYLQKHFEVKQIDDRSTTERENRFLEGTGSIIFDHDNKIAYGCVSERLNKELFIDFCKEYNFKLIAFNAFQTVNKQRLPIYHTNVLMSVAKEFVVICLATIDDKVEQKQLIDTIVNSGKEIMDISEEQMHHFAGNMLQVKNTDGNSFMVMSTAAFNSLTLYQKLFIEKYSEIIHSDLSTIEENGGGSARCMIAEVFLEKRK